MKGVGWAVAVLISGAVVSGSGSGPALRSGPAPAVGQSLASAPLTVRARSVSARSTQCVRRSDGRRALLHCRFDRLALTGVQVTVRTSDGKERVECAQAELPGAAEVDLAAVSGRLFGVLPVRWDAALPVPAAVAPPLTLTDVTATADGFSLPGGRLRDVVEHR
ncbi:MULTISPECIES: hypothetical protein [unclassified Streptomyces]|uniref:hypothetical protein n=1 Tax=unclassified Streptomyces TaxID=2593676 RepID=UPI000372C68E|nr:MULTISPECIES: hypothetical protein [unclassified Streptomyces]MYT28273.1 hypothetical protein [Streptomyces sp. SID8354]